MPRWPLEADANEELHNTLRSLKARRTERVAPRPMVLARRAVSATVSLAVSVGSLGP